MQKSKPCTGCNQIKALSEFYTSKRNLTGYQSKCKSCWRANSSNWYKDNSAQHIANVKANKNKNPERTAAIQRKSEQKKPWLIFGRAMKKRATLMGAVVYEISHKELKRIYSSPCYYCGQYGTATMDHVIPLDKGGCHGIGNIVPACKKCNSSKGTRLITEWLEVRPNAFPLRK